MLNPCLREDSAKSHPNIRQIQLTLGNGNFHVSYSCKCCFLAAGTVHCLPADLRVFWLYQKLFFYCLRFCPHSLTATLVQACFFSIFRKRESSSVGIRAGYGFLLGKEHCRVPVTLGHKCHVWLILDYTEAF